MKKSIAALLVMLTGLSAFSQTVASANILGYTKISVPSNEYVLVALDFDNTNNSVNTLFSALPSGSSVLFWDTTAQTYITVQKTRSGWGTGGTNLLEVGSGAFIKAPAATNVLMSGNVPLTDAATIYVVNGYKLLSYPFPVNTAFTNTTLAKESVSGDSLSLWENNNWTVYQKTRSGWGGATNLQLTVGKAMFYRAAASRAVNETVPYTID